MNRTQLSRVLSGALFAALAIPVSACGGTVVGGGTDAGEDQGTDGATDSSDSGDPWDAVEHDAFCAEPPVVSTETCNESVTYSCGLPIALAGSTPNTDECKVLCDPVTKATGTPGGIFSCWLAPEDGSPNIRVGCATCAVGRRPADLRDDEDFTCADPIADALSEMARIEAASVHAFRRLDRALGRLDAAPELRSRARSAARDEIRHARVVSRLARSRGGARKRVRIAQAEITTFDLALENAVEGCVKETLGVAYLAHQAAHGEDPELRAMASDLYEEELSHAALSWDLIAVFDAHLSASEKETIRRAQERALEEVVAEATQLDPRVRRAFGIPSGAVVRRLVSGLRETLYA